MSEEIIQLEEQRCPACGAPRLGEFCQDCGQRHPVGRLTVRGLLRELPRRFFNVDRGLLHTFLALVRTPGKVPRDYVEGRRSFYINPLTYFLVAAAVQLIMLALMQDSLRQHMETQLGHDPQMVERLGTIFGEEPVQKLTKIYIGLLKSGYTYLFLLFMSVPYALYLRLLTRRLEPRYNLAELLIFSIYTSGHMVLLTGLILPVTTRISAFIHVVAAYLIYALIGLHSARAFFDAGRRRYGLVLLALLGAMVTFFMTLTMIFAGIIFWHAASAG